MVIALAGRRIDPPAAPEIRFPPQNADRVRRELSQLFENHGVTALVSAAAAGADILGLEAAGPRIHRRIVLPFSAAEFRKSSVIDRGEEWGGRYDNILDQLKAPGDLVLLDFSPGDDAAYVATNGVILDEAERLARSLQEPIEAVIVWNGQSRGTGDVTAAFREEAGRRGLGIHDISTL
jgi:hypothetical protein